MNKVILIGRLAQKPFKGLTASSVEYSRFTIAITRNYTAPNTDPISDFVPCIAWRSNATFINKFLDKGSLLLVEGSFQSSRLTDQNGQPINSYVVNAERIQSLETREVSEARKKNNLREFSIPEEENKNDIQEQVNESQPEDNSEINYDGLTWDL